MEPFIHLHVHSQYSLLDGQASISKLVDKAKNDGMKAIALTDHGSMFGVKEFFNYVNKKNAPVNIEIKEIKAKIKLLKESDETDQAEQLVELETQLNEVKSHLFKPILGCECYVARRGRKLKEGKPDMSGWHLVVLAKNLKGYKNLIKMVSLSWTEGYYMRPRIDKELLEKYHEGLIISTACLGGEVPKKITQGNIPAAEEACAWFKNIFGDDFYLELQRHKTDRPDANQEAYPLQQNVNREMLRIGKQMGIKVIATNDVHFTNEEDDERLMQRAMKEANADILYARSSEYFDKMEFGEAIDTFIKAIRSRYDFEKPLVKRFIQKKLNIISLLRSENQRLRAQIQHQQEALLRFANEYYLLGNECIVSYHDTRAALANFNKALEMNPKFLDAWVRKGVTLYDMEDYYEADVCFNEAVRLSPLYFKALYNRGKNRIALKEYDLAITDLDKASSVNPEHPSCHDYLAEAFTQLGENKLAEKHRQIAEFIRQNK